MNKSAWNQIELFYTLPSVDHAAVSQFRQLKSAQDTHTRDERSLAHYCVFFLPFHRASNSIYLGHHKKANDWIPPGGHIDKGELPTETAIREMNEELDYAVTPDMLKPFELSVKEIGRPKQGCLTHYDVWYLVDMPEKTEFNYDTKEYYDASWFLISEGAAEIKHNSDFAKIIKRLDVLS